MNQSTKVANLMRLADAFADAKAERWGGGGRGFEQPQLWLEARSELCAALQATAEAHADVWALIEHYATAKVDCATNPTHESAKAYAKLAESNLREALAVQPEPKGTPDDAQRAKSALADMELLPEDRVPLEAIVAAGYQHARSLKSAAPSPAPVDAVRFVNGCNHGGPNCGRSACERECSAPRQKTTQAPAVGEGHD